MSPLLQILAVLTTTAVSIVCSEDTRRSIAEGVADEDPILGEEYLEELPSKEQVVEAYKFGYEVQDPFEGHQFRHEEKDEQGNVQGRFGYRDSKGQYRQVDYVADVFGFRANVKTNEAGTANENPADVDVQANPPPVDTRNSVPQAKESDLDLLSRSGQGDKTKTASAENEQRSEETQQSFKRFHEDDHPRDSIFNIDDVQDHKVLYLKKPITFVEGEHEKSRKHPEYYSSVILENTDDEKDVHIPPSTYQYVIGSHIDRPERIIKGRHYEEVSRHKNEKEYPAISGETHTSLDMPEMAFEDPIADDLGFYEIYKTSVGAKPSKNRQVSKIVLPRKTGFHFIDGTSQDEEIEEYPEKVEEISENVEVSGKPYSEKHVDFQPGKLKTSFRGRHGSYKNAHKSPVTGDIQTVLKTPLDKNNGLNYNLHQRVPGQRVILEPYYDRERQFYRAENLAKTKQEKPWLRSKKYPFFASTERVPPPTFGTKLNYHEVPLKQAVLQISSDVYSKFLESKYPNQRIIAVPLDRFVLRNKKSMKTKEENAFIHPQGALHMTLNDNPVPKHNKEDAAKFESPPMILHVIHEKGSFKDFGKSRMNLEVDKHHTTYKMKHSPSQDVHYKKRVKDKDYSTTQWIPLTPLWNKIRRSAAMERKSGVASSNVRPVAQSSPEFRRLKCDKSAGNNRRRSAKKASKVVEHFAAEPLVKKAVAMKDCN